MATGVSGWIVDKSAASRVLDRKTADTQVAGLRGSLHLCPVGRLEQLYSARSARQYDDWAEELARELLSVPAPPDIVERALGLQRDLAHHHGLWHRMPIPDLLIAETALYHGMGVATLDKDFERIAKVRKLTVKRLGR